MIVSKRMRARLRVMAGWRRLRRPGGTAVRHRDVFDRAMTIRPKRILLVRLDGLGDFLLTLPAFRHFRSSFPEASLELLVDPRNVELANRSGLFDVLHALPFFKEHEKRRLSDQELRFVLADLQLGSFDLVVDMREYGSTRRLAAVIDAKLRAGFRAPRKDQEIDLLLPNFDQSAPDRRLHMSSRLMSLAVSVTTAFGVRPAIDMDSNLPSGLRRPARSRPNGETLVCVNPFSGRLIKDWPIAHYAALIETLSRRPGARVAIFGDSPSDEKAKRQILAGIPGVTDLGADLPFDTVAAQLAEADLYIGNDSGTTHLAACLGVPTVAIMSGDVDPAVWRPLGESVVLLKGDVPCAPCELNSLAACPVGHLCMQTVLPEAVLAAVDELLGRRGR
jgi:ADP-heptose:LPS heptosyltransferase